MDDKKVAKKKLTLKVLAGFIRDLAGDVKDLREEFQESRMAAIPVNASAEEKAPRVVIRLVDRQYRVTTNGKRFMPQFSVDGGKDWIRIWSPKQSGFLTFRSYERALNYLTIEYGQTANILPREWRAV